MKLSIICAMAHRPKLLILDEATTGLDPVVRDEVLDLFWNLSKMKIALSSFRRILLRTYKNCRLCDFNSSGKIIFEEQKDNLVYNYGVAKCGKENLHSFPLMIISYTELQI